MSRRRRLAQALASGFATAIAGGIYSLATVPIVLAYLPNREYGMWALTTQIVGYLALIDASIAGSISRIIIEHKDDPSGEKFAATFSTTKKVTLAQGIIAFFVGAAAAFAAPPLLDVPQDLRSTLSWLLLGQSANFAFALSSKWISHFVIAYQRYDLANYTQILSLIASFGSLWWALKAGFGLYSVLISTCVATVFSRFVLYFLGRKAGAVPGRIPNARFDRTIFREMFCFGLQLFLQVLGWQLVSGCQIILITRLAGLEAAAIFATCTKTFALAQSLVFRVYDHAVAALAEMAARGEIARLRQRTLELTTLTGVLAVLGSSVLIACNQPFVEWWTSGRIGWPATNDWLYAAVFFAYSVNRIHGMAAWITKDVRRTRFIYAFEGGFVLVAGAIATWLGGIPALLLTSLIGSFAFSGFLGIQASRIGLGIPAADFVLAAWIRPMRVFASMVPVIWLLSLVHVHFIVSATALLVVGSIAAWVFGLPPALRAETRAMFARRTSAQA